MTNRRVVFFLLLLRRVPALALCGLYEVTLSSNPYNSTMNFFSYSSLVPVSLRGSCAISKKFQTLVSAPTDGYSKLDMTVRRGLNRKISLRCYFRDSKNKETSYTPPSSFLLEIAYKPPTLVQWSH